MGDPFSIDDDFTPLLSLAQRQALEYLRGIGDRAVAPSPADIAGLARFQEAFPGSGKDPLETIELLHAAGSPATMATAGGRFFGLVVGAALPATVAASWMATAWDQLALNPTTSPAVAALERIAAGWVLEALSLPPEASVGFVTGTTMGHFTCLAAARSELSRRQGYDLETGGMGRAPPLRIVVSDEIHVSALKVLTLLGFGSDEIERVETDDQGRLRSDRLPQLDERTLLLCQAGNVNSGAFDPFEAICDRAQRARAWVHVDGAFGIWARAAEPYSRLTAGMDRADSWTADAHKWLNTPWDCGFAICRHPAAVARAMALSAEYLKIGEHGRIAPTMVPEMGRRGRGVEVWAALRTLGRSGLAELVDRCCAHARRFEAGLREIGCTILNEVVLNQLVATVGSPAELQAIISRVQASGECWIGPTTWRGRHAFRVSVSSWRTTEADVDRSLAAIAAAIDQVITGRGGPE